MTAHPPPKSQQALTRELRRRVRALRHLWEPVGHSLPAEEALSVVLNPRFVIRLGSADPKAQTILLRSDATAWPASLLHGVLTHELAHLAVHARHGFDAAPHGTEWKALMRAAHLSPTAQLLTRCFARTRARGSAQGSDQTRRDGSGRMFEHRCPVCQMTRVARRPVRQWRCRACTEAGLSGDIVISSPLRT